MTGCIISIVLLLGYAAFVYTFITLVYWWRDRQERNRLKHQPVPTAHELNNYAPGFMKSIMDGSITTDHLTKRKER